MPGFLHLATRLLLAALCAVLTIDAVFGATAAHSQTSPYAAIREQAGWTALEAGDHLAAAAAFRDALTVEPQNANLHFGAALAAFALGRYDEARAAVDASLVLNPTHRLSRELLGRLLHRSGDLRGAIAIYETLVGEGREGTVAETLERWRRDAEVRERMSSAGHAAVTVTFEGPEDAVLAQHALASLERASARIGSVLSYYSTSPLTVVLYTNEQFRDITRSPSWAAGVFDGTIRIPLRGALERPAEFDRVLAHEYTHAIVFELARSRIPTWLNEGLAAALEVERGRADPPRLPVSLDQLRQPFHQLTPAEAHQAYQASAFAVQRLLDDAGGVAVGNLLRDIGDGTAFDTAFEHRMGLTVREFEGRLASQ